MVALSRNFRGITSVESTASVQQGVEVRPLAFLFTDLQDSTALYERVGDVEACEVVRQHFEFAAAVVLDHGGMVVETTGDGVHAGGSVRLELPNGFDYFGSAVNLTARLRSESHDGDVVLSDVVAEHPRVRLLLADLPTREESLPFRGFDRIVRFVRVLPAVRGSADCEHR